MSTQVNRLGRRKVLAAMISLLIGSAAIGLLIFSVSLFSIFAGSRFSGSVAIPVTGVSAEFFNNIGGVLAGAAGGFLLGLAGLISGCSCLPESQADVYIRSRKWLAGLAIGFSVAAMLAYLVIVSYLSTLAKTF